MTAVCSQCGREIPDGAICYTGDGETVCGACVTWSEPWDGDDWVWMVHVEEPATVDDECPLCGLPVDDSGADFLRDGQGTLWHMECWLKERGSARERAQEGETQC